MGHDSCFPAIFFSLIIILTDFLKKILVFVMIWLNMEGAWKLLSSRMLLCTWTGLEAVLFPRLFTMYLAVCNMFCLPINGSGCCWNKCCINTAEKDCLCLDYTLTYVSCALPTVKLLFVRDCPLQCHLLRILDSYIWQRPLTATLASLQLMTVFRFCVSTPICTCRETYRIGS